MSDESLEETERGGEDCYQSHRLDESLAVGSVSCHCEIPAEIRARIVRNFGILIQRLENRLDCSTRDRPVLSAVRDTYRCLGMIICRLYGVSMRYGRVEISGERGRGRRTGGDGLIAGKHFFERFLLLFVLK